MPGLHRLSVALGPAAIAALSFFPTSIALGDKEREEKIVNGSGDGSQRHECIVEERRGGGRR